MTYVNTVKSNTSLKSQSLKILILHPFLNSYGGAEYMLSVLANKMYPTADIFTFSYDEKILDRLRIDKSRVRSPFGSFLGRFLYKQLSPFYPSLIETMNFQEYDIIISLSYAYVHGIVTQPHQLHIAFILTPMRALWIDTDRYGMKGIPVLSSLFSRMVSSQRLWDKVAAARPDYLIAISEEVQKRVRSFWGMDADVIYPPVDTKLFHVPNKNNERLSERNADTVTAEQFVSTMKQEYYITLSRLVDHKRVDIIIRAFQRLGRKLIVIGQGPIQKKLRRIAGSSKNIEFAEGVDDIKKKLLFLKAKGYIFASYEDFGISPVEAIAAGTPVLAYGKGGATETIVNGVTGSFFKEQNVESLIEGFREFEKLVEDGAFKRDALINQAERFAEEKFITTTEKYISQKWEEFQRN